MKEKERSWRVCVSETSGICRLRGKEMGERDEQSISIRENNFLTSLLTRDM